MTESGTIEMLVAHPIGVGFAVTVAGHLRTGEQIEHVSALKARLFEVGVGQCGEAQRESPVDRLCKRSGGIAVRGDADGSELILECPAVRLGRTEEHSDPARRDAFVEVSEHVAHHGAGFGVGIGDAHDPVGAGHDA